MPSRIVSAKRRIGGSDLGRVAGAARAPGGQLASARHRQARLQDGPAHLRQDRAAHDGLPRRLCVVLLPRLERDHRRIDARPAPSTTPDPRRCFRRRSGTQRPPGPSRFTSATVPLVSGNSHKASKVQPALLALGSGLAVPPRVADFFLATRTRRRARSGRRTSTPGRSMARWADHRPGVLASQGRGARRLVLIFVRRPEQRRFAARRGRHALNGQWRR